MNEKQLSIKADEWIARNMLFANVCDHILTVQAHDGRYWHVSNRGVCGSPVTGIVADTALRWLARSIARITYPYTKGI